jgi:hypothetical protein
MFSGDPATLLFIVNFVVIDMSCMTRLTSTALPEVETSSPGKFVWTEPNAPTLRLPLMSYLLICEMGTWEGGQSFTLSRNRYRLFGSP